MTVVATVCPAAPADRRGAARRQRRLAAFHPLYQNPIADLTHGAPALEDLADSFPALLFALASGFGSPAQREHASKLVLAGAPLREAARALGLAWWLRKLPPQAFTSSLPAMPADADFNLRIAGYIPVEERITPSWLARVAYAVQACGARYALWIARQAEAITATEEVLQLIAAWAWFSENRGHLGHRLVRKLWRPEMSFRRAREEMAIWRQRLRLVDCLGPGIEKTWLADGAAADFEFVALRTVDDFVRESDVMDNCLDQYADQLRDGATAVFSIRKKGRSVACVEIGLHETEATMPTIVQLRAIRNRRAPPEIWQATFAWLGSQRLEPLAPDQHTPAARKRTQARRKLWAPYLAFLAGTGHEAPFRSAVLGPMATRRPAASRRVIARRALPLFLRPET